MVVFAKRSPPPSSKSPSFRVLNGSVDKAKQSLVQKLALREKKKQSYFCSLNFLGPDILWHRSSSSSTPEGIIIKAAMFINLLKTVTILHTVR